MQSSNRGGFKSFNDESDDTGVELQTIGIQDSSDDESESKEEFVAEVSANNAGNNANNTNTQLFVIGETFFQFQKMLDQIEKNLQADMNARRVFKYKISLLALFINLTMLLTMVGLIFKAGDDTQNEFPGNGFEDLQTNVDACPGPDFCGPNMATLLYVAQCITSAYDNCTTEMLQALCDREGQIVDEYVHNYSVWHDLNTDLDALYWTIVATVSASWIACGIRSGYKAAISNILPVDQIASLNEYSPEEEVTGTMSVYAANNLLDEIRLNHRKKSYTNFIKEGKNASNRYALLAQPVRSSTPSLELIDGEEKKEQTAPTAPSFNNV